MLNHSHQLSDNLIIKPHSFICLSPIWHHTHQPTRLTPQVAVLVSYETTPTRFTPQVAVLSLIWNHTHQPTRLAPQVADLVSYDTTPTSQPDLPHK